MNIKRGLATLAIAALSLTSLAACGSDTAQDEEKPDSLSFWYYEEDDAGQTQAWRRAAKAFEKETGVKINFERKSFTQIAQNGSQFLNSDEAPDLMESNRGNGSAGVLSTMGLLTDLGDYVKQYGWDKKVTGANAAVAKYDENGIMDGDTWYGMTSYAEFQRVYYNKDLFAKYNIKIPTTYDEFVDACQKFVDAGVTPIAADAQEYGVMWLWWQLVSKNADSKFIDNWQLYRGDVDWNSKVLTNSVKTIHWHEGRGHHAGLHQGRISDLPDWYLEPGPFRQADQVVRLGRGRHAGIQLRSRLRRQPAGDSREVAPQGSVRQVHRLRPLR